MKEQLNFFKIAPKAMQIMLETEKYLKDETTLEPILRELIKTRVSQINGCAYCLNMHTKDALSYGETTQRLFLLNAWRETTLFSEREMAALELAEQVTEISHYDIDEDLVEKVSKHFTNKEIADLIILISQINTWNRINITTHTKIAD